MIRPHQGPEMEMLKMAAGKEGKINRYNAMHCDASKCWICDLHIRWLSLHLHVRRCNWRKTVLQAGEDAQRTTKSLKRRLTLTSGRENVGSEVVVLTRYVT